MSPITTRFAMYQGRMWSIVELSKELGLNPETIWYRAQHGVQLDRAPDRRAQNRGFRRSARVYGRREKMPSLFDNALPYEQDLPAQIAVSFSIARGAPLTLDEIAECMGCNRERVRQIERDALTKLRLWATRTGARADLRDIIASLTELRVETFADRMELEAADFTAQESLVQQRTRRRICQRERRRAA